MSNDYSLRQSVIDSIRHIDEACYDAHIDVTNALIDNYTKDIEIRLYGEQFLQEGSWLDRTPDEHIIKTIFLAIPRFVMHLIRLIKQRWQNIKISQFSEKLVKEQEEALEELKEKEEEYRKWSEFFGDIPNVKYDKESGYFYYYSDIKSYEHLLEYYDAVVAYFVEYEELARDFTVSFNTFNGLHFTMNRYMDREVFSLKNDVKYQLSPEFKELMDEILEKQNSSVEKVDEAMRKVNKWYTRTMASKDEKFTTTEIEMVNRMMDDVRKVRDDFAKIDDRAFRSITSAKDSFILFIEKSKEYKKSFDEDKKKELFNNSDED